MFAVCDFFTGDNRPKTGPLLFLLLSTLKVLLTNVCSTTDTCSLLNLNNLLQLLTLVLIISKHFRIERRYLSLFVTKCYELH